MSLRAVASSFLALSESTAASGREKKAAVFYQFCQFLFTQRFSLPLTWDCTLSTESSRV